jgi:coproporphyrinogen III oxidase
MTIKIMEIESYYNQLNEKALTGFKQLNKTDRVEHKRWEVPAGSWEVNVVRGKILEKASTSRIILNTQNPLIGEDTTLNVFQVKIYPANPKIPIMLFNMENRVAKDDIFAGFLDVAPVAARREDLKFLQTKIKKVTEKHKQNYETLRAKLQDLYRMDSWDKALNAEIGIRLELGSDQGALVKEAGLTWVEAYFQIVEKRKREQFNEKQNALMYAVRARIMEFYLLKDLSVKVAQKLGVPLEALSMAHFAPAIRY